MVFLGRDPHTLPESASFITPSAKGAGAFAVREFLTQGLTSFAFLSSAGNHFWSRDREAEFVHLARLNGFSCHMFGRKKGVRSESARNRALARWLKELPKPCGVMAENDYVAVEVLDLAQKMKIDVPGDIAVIGVDNDTDLCENARPQLSSVLLDFEHAGYRALEILDEIISDPKSGPIRETYPALGLIRRGSTPAGLGVPPRILDALTFIRDKACEGISNRQVDSGGNPARPVRKGRTAPARRLQAPGRHRAPLRLEDGERAPYGISQALRHVHARLARKQPLRRQSSKCIFLNFGVAFPRRE